MPSREICVDQLLERAKNHPRSAAYHVKKNGVWFQTTFKEYGQQVSNFAKGLIALGHESGQAVAILSPNRPEWPISCLAAQMANGVSVGIYSSNSPDETAYVIGHSEAPFVVIENEARWHKQIKPNLAKLPHLKKVILMEGQPQEDLEWFATFQDVLEAGKRGSDQELQERIDAIRPDALATLIYTSGTTGPQKGVMLSHRNLHWTVNVVVRLFNVGEGDTLLSYLPLAHIAEQMFSVYAPPACGLCLYFAESLEKVPDNLREVQPTVFFGVPRVYEKFYSKIRERMDQARGVKSLLLKWARKVSVQVWTQRHKEARPSSFLQLQYGLASRLIFSKVKPLLGLSRARLCVSGAAPISKEIISFFLGLDIPIYEVYGQSEGCGPTTFNLPKATQLGTVGRPVPGVKVKIADDGEILVSGPNLFMGYYKDDAATAETLRDGWLYSGDIGRLDANGYLKITDRKKDLLITAGGKNVAPQNIEGLLKQIPYVSSAVVIGDQRKYLAALLTPNFDSLTDLATRCGISKQKTELVNDSRILQEIQKAIDELNARLTPVEQIKKFHLLPEEFSVETGELTATMKIKRKVINKRYHKAIEALYI